VESRPGSPVRSRLKVRHDTETPPGRRHLISDLCERLQGYLEPSQVADVYRAYLFGAEAHEGQRRRSGEPFIYHPVEVARTLAAMRLDAQTIMAALLHDVIEDTETAKEQIAKDFGKEVAELVDGVSKISQIHFQTKEEEQAENFRKMLLAMGRDIRVILIKLADRLHNMRTLEALPRERQREIAGETLEIYAPIANRLGMRRWFHELEDLGFAYRHPMRHRVLEEAVRKRHGNRKAVVEKIERAIVRQLAQEGVAAEVTGREKNLYSIYKKMRQKALPFEQVYDVYGFRIVVDKVDTCYRVLGLIHNLYKPIPGRFKDYIAIPKANGYQSLHTVVFGPFGVSVEIQIRTEEMDRVAGVGVASHWLYKGGDGNPVPQRTLHWLKELLDIQQKAGNPREFLENLRVDLFSDEVYVFTRNGEIKKLPHGATVIDFAYAVHTDVGDHCISARINHELVPPRTKLNNGDHVEVITADWATPNAMWLDFVVTGKARAHIRSFLKNQKQEEAIHLGERLLARALQALGLELVNVEQRQKQALLEKLKLTSWNELLSEIGLGNRLAAVVGRQLAPDTATEEASRGAKRTARRPALVVRGTEGLVVTYGRCCCPIPGDPILGFLSAGRGIVVHTADCPNVGEYRKHPEKWVDMQWETQIERSFPVNIHIEVRNKRGVLASIAAAIADMEANIDALSFDERDGEYQAMDFTVEVRDRAHLAHIMRRVRSQEDVIRLSRRKG
jgi:guanosine-3',5'-bis(diphosphate) 3'-pyrophosphohydrolase